LLALITLYFHHNPFPTQKTSYEKGRRLGK
jgi:hypothetical protein